MPRDVEQRVVDADAEADERRQSRSDDGHAREVRKEIDGEGRGTERHGSSN